MSKDEPAQVRTYGLQSPGDGVFRVMITSLEGNLGAEAFFAGVGASEDIMLPPGEYLGRVEEVLSGNVTGSFSLVLPDFEMGTIDLKALVVPPTEPVRRLVGGKGEFGSTLDQRASLHALEPPIAGPTFPAATKGTLSPSPLASPRFARAIKVAGKGERSAPTVSHRFEIGLSQDNAPLAKGGWVAATGVEHALDWRADRLILFLRDAEQQRRSKVQMTISVEGLPEIRVPLPLFSAGISVSLISRWDGERPDLGVEIVPHDQRLRQLVGALTHLSDKETLMVLDWVAERNGLVTNAVAQEFLYKKRADNWAAVLAALILVRAGEYGRAQWISNLARIAPHIPDAGIVAAWVKLATEEGDEAHLEREAFDFLSRASRARQPTFAVANSLNLELLNSLRHSAIDKSVRKKADAIFRTASQYSRTRMFNGPFMIWEDLDRRSGGRLTTPEIHTRIASGSVSDAGLERG